MSQLCVVACPGMTLRSQAGFAALALMLGGIGAVPARAAEHITLRNGFDLICDHREVAGDHVRLYLSASGPDFMEVRGEDIAATEFVALPVATPENRVPDPSAPIQPAIAQPAATRTPTIAEIHEMVAKAGAAHDLDVALLDSVIRAESGGNVRAVSHAGARGLMQLMPGTASQLGVTDSFRADQNIDGGTKYLNDLLVRYHDDLGLALAAYNAGPAAVDRYHGIPPYRETRMYVARIIRDFNRRKLAAAHPASALVALATPATASR